MSAAVGVASTAAIPASQMTSSSGSERAATSSSSSSRSAKNTERGLRSVAGTRSHHARVGVSSIEASAVSNATWAAYPDEIERLEAWTLELGRDRHDLVCFVRRRERGRAQVLRRVPEPAGELLSVVRYAESARSQVLWRVRNRAHDHGVSGDARPTDVGTGRRAPSRLDPLRGHRGAHHLLGGP